MRQEDCATLDQDLRSLLGLAIPPIAIAFAKARPSDLSLLDTMAPDPRELAC